MSKWESDMPYSDYGKPYEMNGDDCLLLHTIAGIAILSAAIPGGWPMFTVSACYLIGRHHTNPVLRCQGLLSFLALQRGLRVERNVRSLQIYSNIVEQLIGTAIQDPSAFVREGFTSLFSKSDFAAYGLVPTYDLYKAIFQANPTNGIYNLRTREWQAEGFSNARRQFEPTVLQNSKKRITTILIEVSRGLRLAHDLPLEHRAHICNHHLRLIQMFSCLLDNLLIDDLSDLYLTVLFALLNSSLVHTLKNPLEIKKVTPNRNEYDDAEEMLRIPLKQNELSPHQLTGMFLICPELTAMPKGRCSQNCDLPLTCQIVGHPDGKIETRYQYHINESRLLFWLISAAHRVVEMAERYASRSRESRSKSCHSSFDNTEYQAEPIDEDEGTWLVLLPELILLLIRHLRQAQLRLFNAELDVVLEIRVCTAITELFRKILKQLVDWRNLFPSPEGFSKLQKIWRQLLWIVHNQMDHSFPDDVIRTPDQQQLITRKNSNVSLARSSISREAPEWAVSANIHQDATTPVNFTKLHTAANNRSLRFQADGLILPALTHNGCTIQDLGAPVECIMDEAMQKFNVSVVGLVGELGVRADDKLYETSKEDEIFSFENRAVFLLEAENSLRGKSFSTGRDELSKANLLSDVLVYRTLYSLALALTSPTSSEVHESLRLAFDEIVNSMELHVRSFQTIGTVLEPAKEAVFWCNLFMLERLWLDDTELKFKAVAYLRHLKNLDTSTLYPDLAECRRLLWDNPAQIDSSCASMKMWICSFARSKNLESVEDLESRIRLIEENATAAFDENIIRQITLDIQYLTCTRCHFKRENEFGSVGNLIARIFIAIHKRLQYNDGLGRESAGNASRLQPREARSIPPTVLDLLDALFDALMVFPSYTDYFVYPLASILSISPPEIFIALMRRCRELVDTQVLKPASFMVIQDHLEGVLVDCIRLVSLFEIQMAQAQIPTSPLPVYPFDRWTGRVHFHDFDNPQPPIDNRKDVTLELNSQEEALLACLIAFLDVREHVLSIGVIAPSGSALSNGLNQVAHSPILCTIIRQLNRRLDDNHIDYMTTFKRKEMEDMVLPTTRVSKSVIVDSEPIFPTDSIVSPLARSPVSPGPSSAPSPSNDPIFFDNTPDSNEALDNWLVWLREWMNVLLRLAKNYSVRRLSRIKNLVPNEIKWNRISQERLDLEENIHLALLPLVVLSVWITRPSRRNKLIKRFEALISSTVTPNEIKAILLNCLELIVNYDFCKGVQINYNLLSSSARDRQRLYSAIFFQEVHYYQLASKSQQLPYGLSASPSPKASAFVRQSSLRCMARLGGSVNEVDYTRGITGLINELIIGQQEDIVEHGITWPGSRFDAGPLSRYQLLKDCHEWEKAADLYSQSLPNIVSLESINHINNYMTCLYEAGDWNQIISSIGNDFWKAVDQTISKLPRSGSGYCYKGGSTPTNTECSSTPCNSISPRNASDSSVTWKANGRMLYAGILTAAEPGQDASVKIMQFLEHVRSVLRIRCLAAFNLHQWNDLKRFNENYSHVLRMCQFMWTKNERPRDSGHSSQIPGTDIFATVSNTASAECEFLHLFCAYREKNFDRARLLHNELCQKTALQLSMISSKAEYDVMVPKCQQLVEIHEIMTYHEARDELAAIWRRRDSISDWRRTGVGDRLMAVRGVLELEEDTSTQPWCSSLQTFRKNLSHNCKLNLTLNLLKNVKSARSPEMLIELLDVLVTSPKLDHLLIGIRGLYEMMSALLASPLAGPTAYVARSRIDEWESYQRSMQTSRNIMGMIQYHMNPICKKGLTGDDNVNLTPHSESQSILGLPGKEFLEEAGVSLIMHIDEATWKRAIIALIKNQVSVFNMNEVSTFPTIREYISVTPRFHGRYSTLAGLVWSLYISESHDQDLWFQYAIVNFKIIKDRIKFKFPNAQTLDIVDYDRPILPDTACHICSITKWNLEHNEFGLKTVSQDSRFETGSNCLQTDPATLLHCACEAIKGFMKSARRSNLNCGNEETSRTSSFVKYQWNTLYIMYIWIKGRQNETINKWVEYYAEDVAAETWRFLVPQLLPRINDEACFMARPVNILLTRLCALYPHDMILPLITSKRLQHSTDSELFNEYFSCGLREDCDLFCKGFKKVATTLQEECAFLKHGEQNQKFEDLLVKLCDNDSQFSALDAKYIKYHSQRAKHLIYDDIFKLNTKLNQSSNPYRIKDINHIAPELLAKTNWELNIPGKNIQIFSVLPNIEILNSKRKPKKIRFLGKDGNFHCYLLKSNEDLRQDQLAIQLLELLNELNPYEDTLPFRYVTPFLTIDSSTCPSTTVATPISNVPSTVISMQLPLLVTCKVVPLPDHLGFVSWLHNTSTIADMIASYREITKKDQYLELKMAKLISKNYQSLPNPSKLLIFSTIINETSACDLRDILIHNNQYSPKHNTVTLMEMWFNRRTNYIRSLAAMSVFGYIIGLGDRHCSNILIDRHTGQIIHIDFGDCFDVTMLRKHVPERVPFRLTRMLIQALGPSGHQGQFHQYCVDCMNLIRHHEHLVYSILDTIIFDPVASWTEIVKHSDELKCLTRLPEPLSTDSSKLLICAVHVLEHCRSKIEGTETGEHEVVASQVARLIYEATDPHNLSRAYLGWNPFW